MLDIQLGFIGGGQMARALASGLVANELLKASQILVHDPAAEATEQFLAMIPGSRSVDNNHTVASEAHVVFLAIKPQHLQHVMKEIGKSDSQTTLIVSLVAGTPLERLEKGFGTGRIVRVMPNTPCLVGLGSAGYCLGSGANPDDGRLVQTLLSAVGIAFLLDEPLLDVVTGLSGSGPAYVFTIIEALSDGGVRMGLPREVAMELATQTVLGAASMVKSTGDHPAVLKDRVASPGGTTIAGLQKLEEHGLRAALIAAVEAATERAAELGCRQ